MYNPSLTNPQEQLSGVAVIREMNVSAVGYTALLRGRHSKSSTQEITKGKRMSCGVQPTLCPNASVETDCVRDIMA
jgi:predicted neuraminidase